MTEVVRPRPVLDPWNRPFWDAVADRRLVLQRCDKCGTFWFPPGPVCQGCASSSFTWTPSSGRGFILSHCRFHQLYFPTLAPLIPYVVGVVRLVEGPRVVANVTASDEREIRIGAPVRAYFSQDADGFIVPVFGVSHEQ